MIPRILRSFAALTALAALAVSIGLTCLGCGSGPGPQRVLRVPFADTLSVQVRLPAGYDSSRAYPILIGLHGRGGKAGWFLRLWKRISAHGIIYVVPEASYAFGNGFAWFRNQPYDSLRISQDRARSEEFIAAVAKAALARFGGSEAYLLGFSQGGNLAYHTGLRYAGLFQGVIAFGAYLDVATLSPEKRKGAEGMQAFIVHGRKDRAIAFPEGEEAYQNLRAFGCQTVFREFPGGHEVDGASLEEALDWMSPNPKPRTGPKIY